MTELMERSASLGWTVLSRCSFAYEITCLHVVVETAKKKNSITLYKRILRKHFTIFCKESNLFKIKGTILGFYLTFGKNVRMLLKLKIRSLEPLFPILFYS